MVNLSLISVHFQVMIVIFSTLSVYQKGKKFQIKESFKLCSSSWKYSVCMVPSLNPEHFDCLWVINHTGYFLVWLKRIIGTGFCTLSVLQSDTSTLGAGLQPGSEPACLPSHWNHLQMPPTLLVTVSTKSVQPKQKIQIKAPGRQGKGERDRFQPKEQVIKHGFSFWDPGRNQMPTAQKLWYRLNSCEQVESKKEFHFVLNWGMNLTPLLLCRGACGLFFKETYYFTDFSAP